MNVYIYNADIYCEDCGKLMRLADGPYSNGGGKADCPQHCGSHALCFNADELMLSDGKIYKVGCFLENPLTAEGVEYVKEQHKNSPSDVTRMWMDFYDIKENE